MSEEDRQHLADLRQRHQRRLYALERQATTPTRAARLLAAAERIREEKSAPHWPADRGEYDTLVDAVRMALNEEAFEQAWAAGRALTLERAIAEGLSTGSTN
jgi:hypothetical protein